MSVTPKHFNRIIWIVLDSVGIGLRLKLGGLSVDLDGARAGTAGYITRAGSYSAQFRINYSH